MAQYLIPLEPELSFSIDGTALEQVCFFEARLLCDTRGVCAAGQDTPLGVWRGVTHYVITMRRLLTGRTELAQERLMAQNFTLRVQRPGLTVAYEGCELLMHRCYVSPETGLMEEAQFYAPARKNITAVTT